MRAGDISAMKIGPTQIPIPEPAPSKKLETVGKEDTEDDLGLCNAPSDHQDDNGTTEPHKESSEGHEDGADTEGTLSASGICDEIGDAAACEAPDGED